MKLACFFIFFFILFFAVFLITSSGNTPYNYFTRLADSFLHGKYWLSEAPPWLNELIPIGANKFYVVYPPMPAILAMPFVAVFGKSFPQQYLAHLVGAGIAIASMAISLGLKKNYLQAIWVGLLTGVGTIIWFMASNGSVWLLGQITAALFLTLAILSCVSKKPALLVGLFLGAAYLSRLQTILSLPFFVYEAFKNKKIKGLLGLALGIAPFILFNFGYNYLRHGVFWDKSYTLIPGLFSEPWYAKGLFHYSYIPNHLRVMFTSLPIFKNTPPFVIPSWGGLAIWVTTPAFIYALFAPLKKASVILSWISVIFITLLVFMHGTTGFSQFGYRFAVDFYPFLIFLVINSTTQTSLKWHHWILLILSIATNLWGVLWINKFHWVGF